ncbi:M14 family metallopeptidase [Sandarakinorhabdus limnophila]|jgi:murein tripeptide amidase MpaA|uniref:M14 family metallopeptidase n=1 Tax=Sandarakinorhabdus limnophila TaxID=210512 RepID=UPI0026EDD8FB|nr:M14-type cytosolic carboxypeptidase [Sandarakinorhabdus limnophila]
MISIDTAFDSGNIQVERIAGPHEIVLTIGKDAHSDFYQWFHFRLSGAKDQRCIIRIIDLNNCAYPGGWPGYRACVSGDRQTWRRALTSFDPKSANGTLTIEVTPSVDQLWLAYFAPYSMERHHDLIARIAAQPGVRADVLGLSLDGRAIDRLVVGDGAKTVWLYARQHPGESMAEWWMEGALERLTDPHDPVARTLRQQATFHIVPNMNPDGSFRGHLRTNAAGVNLNREWQAPSAEKSPEVLCVRQAMDKTGCDLAMDVHGDEAIPQVFIAGFEGIPSITPKQLALLADYKARLARITPDFQTAKGYPVARPGTANLAMSTNQLAERFGCLAMTLEMPFKDNDDLPCAEYGWSPQRSMQLGRDCLAAIMEVMPEL